jgi:hypothetical protein
MVGQQLAPKSRCSWGMCSASSVSSSPASDVEVHALILAGDDDVDAVGPVAHVLVEPRQLDLEVLGAEPDRPENAQAAGPRHGGDDVTAVAEGEDRELDAQLVADLGAHPAVPCSCRRRRLRNQTLDGQSIRTGDRPPLACCVLFRGGSGPGWRTDRSADSGAGGGRRQGRRPQPTGGGWPSTPSMRRRQ